MSLRAPLVPLSNRARPSCGPFRYCLQHWLLLLHHIYTCFQSFHAWPIGYLMPYSAKAIGMLVGTSISRMHWHVMAFFKTALYLLETLPNKNFLSKLNLSCFKRSCCMLLRFMISHVMCQAVCTYTSTICRFQQVLPPSKAWRAPVGAERCRSPPLPSRLRPSASTSTLSRWHPAAQPCYNTSLGHASTQSCGRMQCVLHVAVSSHDMCNMSRRDTGHQVNLWCCCREPCDASN